MVIPHTFTQLLDLGINTFTARTTKVICAQIILFLLRFLWVRLAINGACEN